jgi:hypothetical protein
MTQDIVKWSERVIVGNRKIFRWRLMVSRRLMEAFLSHVDCHHSTTIYSEYNTASAINPKRLRCIFVPTFSFQLTTKFGNTCQSELAIVTILAVANFSHIKNIMLR